MANKTLTTNGAGAYKSTGSALVDLFFNIGAARNNLEGISKNFDSALASDPLKATAILMWARDIRVSNGAGERAVFKKLLPELIKEDSELAEKVIKLVPKFGRFDDLRVVFGTSLEKVAIDVWVDELKKGNALAFKWIDRKDVKIRMALDIKNEGSFRKWISANRKNTIVEHKMCTKNWSGIEYSKLPSVAGARYANAFKKHDSIRYLGFIGDKDTTVNTSTNFPHDVYRMYSSGNREAASKYWYQLPDLCAVGNVLPLVDVSGSMSGAKASGSVTCMDVAVSLGVYLAQRIKGAFNGKLMTFSESPTIVKLPKTKDIGELFSFVSRMNWGMNTNIEKAFNEILACAKKDKISNEDMPKVLLVLSDMQFDSACGRRGTINKVMKDAFNSAGYTMPTVVYWNLNASFGNVPTTVREDGVVLVSGFSPKILQTVLAGKSLNAVDIVEDAIKPYMELIGTV